MTRTSRPRQDATDVDLINKETPCKNCCNWEYCLDYPVACLDFARYVRCNETHNTRRAPTEAIYNEVFNHYASD